jgi:Zn-dependent M28 family amino/carboxypeptidase
MTYPSYFPPNLEERLREGYYIYRAIEASKVSSRAKAPDFSIRIPVFLVPYSLNGEGAQILREREEIHLEVSLRFKEILLRDLNIGGIIYGNDPGRKEEFLVLGSHYDHLGTDEKKGVFYSGADDNASGVAALLEIGHALVGRKKDLRRSLILLFFGGEEWGLRGSEHFLKSPFVPLPQIKAMLSLDAIGGLTEEKEIFFIGGSFHPSLAERSRGFLKKLGMKEGRDIDRYAFPFGSDHYPFHQRGIPSLDYFASDYKKLHTLRDNIGMINFDGLADVTRLIYLTAYEYLTEP